MASLGLHYDKKVTEEIADQEEKNARKKNHVHRQHTFGFDGWPMAVHPVMTDKLPKQIDMPLKCRVSSEDDTSHRRNPLSLNKKSDHSKKSFKQKAVDYNNLSQQIRVAAPVPNHGKNPGQKIKLEPNGTIPHLNILNNIKTIKGVSYKENGATAMQDLEENFSSMHSTMSRKQYKEFSSVHGFGVGLNS